MKPPFLVVSLFLTLTHLFGLTSEEIAKRAFPASVMLVLFDENGEAVKSGSGFFISPDVVATNYHVVANTYGGVVKSLGNSILNKIEKVEAVNSTFDLALLRVELRSDATLDLGDSRNLNIGQPVFVVGNPQGLEGTFSNGLVSSIRRFGDDYLVQMTAPISLGSSGGPVLNDEGKVVGVSVGMFQGGQNLNFAIPSEYLVNLLKLLRNAPPSGSIVEAREKDFYSPSLSLSSRLVQKSNKRAGVPKTSIHDLDFIEHTRPSYKKEKSKAPAEDLFIMTR